jgi:hypothetical protein
VFTGLSGQHSTDISRLPPIRASMALIAINKGSGGSGSTYGGGGSSGGGGTATGLKPPNKPLETFARNLCGVKDPGEFANRYSALLAEWIDLKSDLRRLHAMLHDDEIETLNDLMRDGNVSDDELLRAQAVCKGVLGRKSSK